MIFEHCLNQLGVNSNEALYIGDNYKKDFVGAINSGLSACLIDRKVDRKIESLEKGFIINSLAVLHDTIKEINKKQNIG